MRNDYPAFGHVITDRDFIERPASVLPEILEPIRRHLGVSDCVHDIFVAHVVLKGSGVMPIIGQLVSSGVPEHVGVDREWKLCRFPGPGDRFQESRRRGGATALGDKNVPRFHILTTKLTQCPDFPAA
jgi:hypothetical protein